MPFFLFVPNKICFDLGNKSNYAPVRMEKELKIALSRAQKLSAAFRDGEEKFTSLAQQKSTKTTIKCCLNSGKKEVDREIGQMLFHSISRFAWLPLST